MKLVVAPMLVWLLVAATSAQAFLTPGSLGTCSSGGCASPKMTGNGMTIELTVPNPIINGASVNGVLNVQAYGADPTGVADSTSAIQSTITAACPGAPWTSGPAITCTAAIHLPAGKYKVMDLSISSILLGIAPYQRKPCGTDFFRIARAGL